MSANSLIDPTTQKIATRFLSNAIQNPVTSINAQSGSILMLAGANMTINTNGSILTFSANIPAQVPQTYVNASAQARPGVFDIFNALGEFLPFATIPIPANYQNATVYKVSFDLATTYVTPYSPLDLYLYATSMPIIPPAFGGTPNDVITFTDCGAVVNGADILQNGVLTVANAVTTPVTNIYVYLATKLPVDPNFPPLPGTMNNTVFDYVIEAVNAS